MLIAAGDSPLTNQGFSPKLPPVVNLLYLIFVGLPASQPKISHV